MGEALGRGLLDARWASADELLVVEPVAARRDQLAELLPGVRTVAAPDERADGAVVAVKPADVPDAVRAVVAAGTGRLLSIAAGVTLERLEAAAGPDLPVVRAMPNTPALVGEGAAAIAPGTAAGEDDLAWAEEVLRAVGAVVRVSEPLLDAVTGLSGSGPAYLFLVAEALVEGGVRAGLPRDVSVRLTEQTLLGAARLLVASDEGPEALRAAVTSPGGTTAAGLHALEAAGVRAALSEAVRAAAERSAELGRG